jgi:D-3-phosphoglycerate dehydrogenase
LKIPANEYSNRLYKKYHKFILQGARNMKVYLSEYIDPKGVDMLKERAEIVTTFDNIEEIDAIIVRSVAVTAEMIQKAKKLKVIGKHGVGYNQIDVEEAKRKGVKVVYTPGMNSESVAEMVISLMLNVSRKVSYGFENCKKDKYSAIAPEELTGNEIKGKTIALIGFGNVARQLSTILKNGFEMNVIAFDNYIDQSIFDTSSVKRYKNIEEMLPEADYLSISVPLTKETENLISEKQLKLMKNTAILINTSRGGIVDENALYHALVEGIIAGAGCDVFTIEPPTSKNPLMGLRNFIGTPHMGGTTKESLERCATTVVSDTFRVLDGKAPNFPVK